MKPTRNYWLLLLGVTLLLASEAGGQVTPRVVIENSLNAIGGPASAAKIDTLHAWADCAGPNGPYTTEIASARGGKIFFSQKRQSGKPYFGRGDGRNAIAGSEPSSETKAASEREVFVWRAHDFARIAIDVEGFFGRLEMDRDTTFGGKPAIVLNAEDHLGNPARIYYEKGSGLMLGYSIRNPFGTDEIRTVFAEWKPAGEVKLPSKVVVTDSQGDFVLNFTKFTINDVDPGMFAVPSGDRTSTENMALIPGATFEMGQDTADIPKLMERFKINRAELFQEETPKQKVMIGSFYLDRDEVTNAQFKGFVDQSPEWGKEKNSVALHNGKYLQHWNGNQFPADKADHPVTFVSWYAANAYCSSVGKRLPTEAEWEFAARGGLVGKAFPWGDEMPDKTRANYAASELKAPTKVGSYPANGYGLHDMAGNVWEYLSDELHKYPVKPTAEPNYLPVKTRRALRGGSFGGAPVNLRVTYRDSHSPENAVEHVGFRCALTSPQQSEDVNEILRMHYRDRAAHFNHDAAYIFSNFADEYFSLGNGRVNLPDRATGEKRLQTYFDASTFLEWDDITPPIIRISDDRTMAYSLVHKKVRLLDKNNGGKEEIDVFAWSMTLRKIGGKWKVTSVTSTRTPEEDR